jgi:tol-pal system protein YbgF
MTKTSTRAFITSAFALALLIAQPAAARDKEHMQLAADLRILQEQSQQLQNLLGQLSDALKLVNQRIDEQSKANVKAFADQKLIIDTVSKDLAIVREKLDDTNTRVGSVSQEVEALRQSVQQLATARQSTAADPADGAAAGVPTTDATAGAASQIAIGLSPQRLFDGAKADYAATLWDLAITGFRAYITSFPRSDMADDAQVLIGNSYFNDGKNDKAIEAYDVAIRTYANGNAIPEAYYKKGLAHRNLKQLDQARQAFEFVIRTYPQSAEAGLARQALGAITPAAGPAPR